ncbi:hypothetical protein HMPREF9431_01059 [Segatella oulorum F0390]|uniref:Uncharacterized protein n=1 Tax=Segatella oulorum F0390 TaxID=702438 RepID=G1WB58_9BACT|nr:hypothetical protein HMPREF9431_01059 [Segatella oulorum F0390]
MKKSSIYALASLCILQSYKRRTLAKERITKSLLKIRHLSVLFSGLQPRAAFCICRSCIIN